MAIAERIKVIVRWFNSKRGYGLGDGANEKVYILHFSQIASHGTGFRSLDPGEEVEITPVLSGDPTKGPRAEDVRRITKKLKPLSSKAPEYRFEKTRRFLELTVGWDNNIVFPNPLGGCDRDYVSGNVEAFYLGAPGYYRELPPLSVELQKTMVRGNTAIVGVNEDGGVLPRRFLYDFRPGHFVLAVTVDGGKVYAEAKQISFRMQNSTNSIAPQDHGVWVVADTVFKKVFEGLPDTENEYELKMAIRDQIPDPENFETKKRNTSMKVFGKAIAQCILELKPDPVVAQAAQATA
ncbi:MAG: cold shock domain-containing protein [Candidatus Giovannonibacteria bacterium]|nr:MAG: cold shock domain-containing protein [Candidatus Giovannonibacteria bacterium]